MTNLSGLGTPVVMLVVEGGPNTIKTVYSAVSSNIPVVIIKSSGRAADILCKVLDRVKGINTLVIILFGINFTPTNLAFITDHDFSGLSAKRN